jgi:hypothetical protein
MDYWTDILPASLSAQQMLTSVSDDMGRLPDSVRIFLLVHGAQGVIDNGGYKYFFEADWPGNPPYEHFSEAYEAIGCISQAADLRRVAGTFPFQDAHLRKDERKAFIDARYDEKTHCVPEWGDALCGDTEVFEKLALHIALHRKDFPPFQPPKPWWKFW